MQGLLPKILAIYTLKSSTQGTNTKVKGCLGLFYVNTVVSTKVVPQKCKRVRDISIMGRIVRVWLCLIEVQGDSATRNEKKGIHVFVLFPSTTLKNLEFNQLTVKTTITHNNFCHCQVSFSQFVQQPFSKQLYLGR